MRAADPPRLVQRRSILAAATAAPVLGATAAHAQMASDSAAPIRQFATRSDFIAWAGTGAAVPDGTVVLAGRAWIAATSGANDIPDAPGWHPAQRPAQLSCWADTTAGHQAAWDWSHANDGAPLLLDYDLTVTATEYWGHLTLLDAGGSITSHADTAFMIPKKAGPWGRDACILTRSANRNTEYGDAITTQYRMRIGSPANPIRWLFDKSDAAKPSFPVRFIGLKDSMVAIDISGTSKNPGGGKFEHAPPDFYFFNQDTHVFIRSRLYNEQATNGGLWIRDINLGQLGPEYGTRNLTLNVECYDETTDETVAIFNTYSKRFVFSADAGQIRFRGSDTQGLTLAFSDTQRVIVRRSGILLREGADYTAHSRSGAIVLSRTADAGDAVVVLVAAPGYLKNICGRVVAHSKHQLAFNVINNAEMPAEWLSGHLDVFAISDNARNNQGVFQTRCNVDFTFGTVHVDINGGETGARQIFGAAFKNTSSLGVPDKPVRVNDLIVRINGILGCGDGVVDMIYGHCDVDCAVTKTSGSVPATSMKHNLVGRLRGGDLCNGSNDCVFRVNQITGGVLRGRVSNSNVLDNSVTIYWDTDVQAGEIYRTSDADPAFVDDSRYIFNGHILARGTARPGSAVNSKAQDRVLFADYTIDHTDAGGAPEADRIAGPVAVHRYTRINGTVAENLVVANGAVTDSAGTWMPTLAFGGQSTGIDYAEQTGRWRIAAGVLHFDISITLNNRGGAQGPAAVTLPTSLPANIGIKAGSGAGIFTGYRNMAALSGPVASAQGRKDNPELGLFNQTGSETVALTEANFTGDSHLQISGSLALTGG